MKIFKKNVLVVTLFLWVEYFFHCQYEPFWRFHYHSVRLIYKFLKNRFPEYLQWNDNQLLVHQDFEKRFNVRGLHFLHLNVRSVLHKISELRILFSRKSLAVIAFTETWLNDSINDEEIDIDGYKVVRRDRTSGSGGGVCLYIRSDIAFNINIDIRTDDIESRNRISKDETLSKIYRALRNLVQRKVRKAKLEHLQNQIEENKQSLG